MSRTLYKGMWSSEGHYKFKKGDYTPPRNGVRWNDYERADLYYAYMVGRLPLGHIAQRHGRGASGITIELDRILNDKVAVDTVKDLIKTAMEFKMETEREALKPNLPHPNAAIIKRWADGREVEYRSTSTSSPETPGPWWLYTGQVNIGDTRFEWRVAERSEDFHFIVERNAGERQVLFHQASEQARNSSVIDLVLTFRGDTLVAAKVPAKA
jgi:hypothetical protein